MRPVRGTPPDEVARNQRERLFAAIIACVADRGFAATTVEDLVDLSGVSRRSFYDYFDDKASCLLGALKEILGFAIESLQVEEGKDYGDVSLRRYLVLADFAVSQPAASKVILNDHFAAGPEAVGLVRDALHEYERLIRRSAEESPEHAGMPAEIITARLGGVVEISRARLRAGKAEDLPGLGPEIVAMTMSDRPPAQPLRLSGQPSEATAESLDAADHSERAIRAFAKLVAEHGYASVSVDDVVRLASMSATTFYSHFSGKDDLMAAAIDRACAEALAAVVPAFNQHSWWPDAVRAGFGALLDFLASRPALASLVTVEVYAAGDDAIERRVDAIAPLGALVENNTTIWGRTPSVVFEMIAGGVAHLLHEAVRRAGPSALPGLAPVCTYITLSPFIGAEEAARAANEETASSEAAEGHGSHGVADTGAIGLSEPMRITPWMAMAMSERKPTTVAEIAAAAGEKEAAASKAVEQLAKVGVLERMEDRDGQPTYQLTSRFHPLSIISTRQLAAMGREEAMQVMSHVWIRMREELDEADELGRFGDKLDSVLTRTPMTLDDQGWEEMAQLHEDTLNTGIEIAESSRKRLEDSGGESLEARSMQAFFHLPDRDDE